MNPIEKVMINRRSNAKLAFAVLALELVLWATGSSNQTLWITPVTILVLWVVLRLALKYRNRHPC